jgi:hypothetical protein
MKLSHRFSILLLISIGLITKPLSVADAAGITIQSMQANYTFAQSITFTAVVSSDTAIQQATLFFQAGGAAPIKQAAQAFTAANQVTITAQIDLAQIKPPAFSTISYWWEVDDQAGKHLQSAVQSLAYIDNRFNWQDFTSKSIRVHWLEGDSGFAANAASIANEALPKIQQQLGARPPSPIDIYIYATVAQLRSAVELTGRPWLGGLARPEFGVVLVAIANDESASINMRRDIPHELTHLLVFVAASPNYHNLPHWLDEGLASLNEEEPNPTQAVALQNAWNANQLLAIESLCGAFPIDASSAVLAYAESRGVVQQIVNEYGSAGLQALLAAYRDGAACQAGVERGLKDSIASLELKWKSTLAPGGGATSIIVGVAPWLVLVLIVALPLIGLIPKRDKMKR